MGQYIVIVTGFIISQGIYSLLYQRMIVSHKVVNSHTACIFPLPPSLPPFLFPALSSLPLSLPQLICTTLKPLRLVVFTCFILSLSTRESLLMFTPCLSVSMVTQGNRLMVHCSVAG